MNENHSQAELKYKTRWLASLLREASQAHPIIVLTGARQVGKSTLLQHEPPFASWKHLTLDDFDVLAALCGLGQMTWSWTKFKNPPICWRGLKLKSIRILASVVSFFRVRPTCF
jgi:hypothetical protein